MYQKKILVPVGAGERDLKSVYYAMSLADRLQAQVFILQEAGPKDAQDALGFWLGEALPDLINTARQAGLKISHLIVRRPLKEEIVTLAREEGIDLLVFGADAGDGYGLPLQIKPFVAAQIIQVSEKDHIRYL